jgi:tRNA threonylcarbamoyladenosine biosynthesis protein TsaB
VPVLAIDTATALTTVAIAVDPGGVVAEASHLDPRRHAEVLPHLVRDVLTRSGLAPADLDLVAVGVGPGPFTGLRVGISFAQAIAHGLGIRAVGAMSLDVIAQGHRSMGLGPFTVVTRSRRVEAAWATYTVDAADRLRRTAGPLIQPDPGFPRDGRVIGDVEDVDAVARPSAGCLADLVIDRLRSGEAPPPDREWPQDAADGSGTPTARILEVQAGQGRWLLPPRPLYLRRPDAVPA